MPRAEVGSTKYVANRMKAKGLQRLRWYCQVCERQMRDANGFKQHTLSEGHMRAILVVGENAHKHVADFTKSFMHDFLHLLKTAHGTKSINANHFYQEYIANKEHIHMNSTRFASLSEFVKHLGREGICRVEEGDRGLMIAWIDNSPEALRRQDALRRKERQDRGDEEREQRMIAEQVERARKGAEEKGDGDEEVDEEEANILQREEGQKIKLDFGARKEKEKEDVQPQATPEDPTQPLTSKTEAPSPSSAPPEPFEIFSASPLPNEKPKVSLSMSTNKPKNVFNAGAKKNALGSAKPAVKPTQQRPMSEAERIMKEEIERKRKRGNTGFGGWAKKTKDLS